MLDLISDQDLKIFNSFGINAKAKRFLKLSSEQDFTDLLSSSLLNKNDFLILGGGSNLLFTANYPGLVIHTANKGIHLQHEDENEVILEVKSGESWDEFVEYCVNHGYQGIENLSLIPGTAGSAPVQNIGAYGVEISDRLVSLSGIDLKLKERRTMNVEECRFSYRNSVFKNELKNRFIIESVRIRLNKTPSFILNYGNVEKEFMKNPVQDLKSLRKTIIRIRESKLPDHKTTGNAGSFFKNPVIGMDSFKLLREKFPDIPSYSAVNGVKIPAAWLIEKAGWKGKRVRDVGTWPMQPLVIVNYGNAGGKEILEFSEEIRNAVKELSGIELEREVNVV